MNISQIRYMIKVYELNSFTEASKNLYISQSRLSQAIQSLERELGFDIFERNRKGIKGTTTRGYEFIRQSIKAMEEFSQLEKWIPSGSHTLHISSTLNTQAQDAFEMVYLENIDAEDMDIDFWITSCYESSVRVKNMESDIGVITILGPQYDKWQSFFLLSGLEYHNMTMARFYVTVSRESPLGREYLANPMLEPQIEDLQKALFITEKSFRMNELTYEVYALISGICPDIRATVANTDIMYHLVVAAPQRNAFVLEAIRPSAKTLARYGLVSMPLKIDYEIYYGYIQRKGEALSAMSRQYLDVLAEELKK